MGEIGAALAAVAVAGWLITLSAFDIRQRRLPNRLTLPGAAVILIAAAACGHGAAAVLGAAALFGVYAAVHLVAPAAMGAGDVKLAIGLGALTGAFGPDVWMVAAVGASLLSALLGLSRLAQGAGSRMPHGPSMCLAAGAAVAVAVI
ncbi:prepilin signal peptidase PulO-like peptidase [Mycolicibacterium chubuense NBB4]|uniref:Prepilin signal peptidase PulO-like peptidase n=1 Tax=Mycolicibacterium chubuense (strain NBB4) TaxID=710421 RepID=I4BIQ0_MYCCN|nr:A24 family peptidase [Mycolicibacterium chubuense]AFM17157.1 prepilin signal peptidase PulO-like peptidase [Mycolicibacterium chubuense NBB4]